MNEVQNFDFEGNEVRTIQKDSMTWFAANELVLKIINDFRIRPDNE